MHVVAAPGILAGIRLDPKYGQHFLSHCGDALRFPTETDADSQSSRPIECVTSMVGEEFREGLTLLANGGLLEGFGGAVGTRHKRVGTSVPTNVPVQVGEERGPLEVGRFWSHDLLDGPRSSHSQRAIGWPQLSTAMPSRCHLSLTLSSKANRPGILGTRQNDSRTYILWGRMHSHDSFRGPRGTWYRTALLRVTGE